jgi:hypothetical protein
MTDLQSSRESISYSRDPTEVFISESLVWRKKRKKRPFAYQLTLPLLASSSFAVSFNHFTPLCTTLQIPFNSFAMASFEGLMENERASMRRSTVSTREVTIDESVGSGDLSVSRGMAVCVCLCDEIVRQIRV